MKDGHWILHREVLGFQVIPHFGCFDLSFD